MPVLIHIFKERKVAQKKKRKSLISEQAWKDSFFILDFLLRVAVSSSAKKKELPTKTQLSVRQESVYGWIYPIDLATIP